MRAKSLHVCDVPGPVGRYLRAASESTFRSSGRCGTVNRAEAGQRMEQGGELVGDLLLQVLVCSDVFPQFLDENLPLKPSYGMASEWSKLLVWSSDFLFLVQQCHQLRPLFWAECAQ